MYECSQSERRNAPRIDLHMDGSIRITDQSAPLVCGVRNLSEIGARVQVESANHVPDIFWLHLEHEGFSAKCNVVWRTGRELGVIFARAS